MDISTLQIIRQLRILSCYSSSHLKRMSLTRTTVALVGNYGGLVLNNFASLCSNRNLFFKLKTGKGTGRRGKWSTTKSHPIPENKYYSGQGLWCGCAKNVPSQIKYLVLHVYVSTPFVTCFVCRRPWFRGLYCPSPRDHVRTRQPFLPHFSLPYLGQLLTFWG